MEPKPEKKPDKSKQLCEVTGKPCNWRWSCDEDCEYCHGGDLFCDDCYRNYDYDNE